MESFGALIKGAFGLLNHKFTLPWFGEMSALRMMVIYALLQMVVGFVNRLLGGSGDDEEDDYG